MKRFRVSGFGFRVSGFGVWDLGFGRFGSWFLACEILSLLVQGVERPVRVLKLVWVECALKGRGSRSKSDSLKFVG